jgi:hypothetical protein
LVGVRHDSGAQPYMMGRMSVRGGRGGVTMALIVEGCLDGARAM